MIGPLPGVLVASLLSPQAILCHRFAVLYDGNLSGSFLWLAYSQHVGVGGYTGLRSFHELHPVLGCGRLTACAMG